MRRWYYWASALFLLGTIQAFSFIDRLVYGSWDGKPGDKITQFLNMLMIIASLSLFIRSLRQGLRGTAVGCLIAAAIASYLLSTVFWSTDPATTIRLAIIYIYTIAGCIGIARSLQINEFMHLLSGTCLLAAVASVVLAVIAPATAFNVIGTQDGADFIGAFPHKNVLGQVMASGALATLHDMRVSRRWRSKSLVLLLFLVMAVASRSTAAVMTSVAFCAISGFASLWQRPGTPRAIAKIACAVLVPCLIVAIFMPDQFLELIGKDSTLTGRTEIWSYVIRDIAMKPWLGWGYFGFWNADNPAAIEISDAVHWVVPQAHNGLLEMLLTIGFAGTSLFALLLVRTFVFAFLCLRSHATALAISVITCCIGILLEGVSETVLLAPNESLTPVLFITGLMCERAVWLARQRQPRGRAPWPSFRAPVSAPLGGRDTRF